MTTEEILKKAKAASPSLMLATTEQKNEALQAMADELFWDADDILAENEKDMNQAREAMTETMLDRLKLTSGRLQAMAEEIQDVASLPDPVGRILSETKRADGIVIQKCSVPFGVIAVIYESRPNVTSDAAALCIKSGNSCVLRCGREAINSARAIVKALQKGLNKAGLSEDLIQLVEDTSRESARELMTANKYVDLLIPRGGAGLIKACVDHATVNCIETGTGICHIYVDKDADLHKALRVIDNAKTNRPAMGNAAEVCVVHEDIAESFLPRLKERLIDDRIGSGATPVELRLDVRAASILMDGASAREPEESRISRIQAELNGQADHFLAQADVKDFDTEFLDYILAVKVVDSLDDAIAHILEHSTGYSDAIITENKETAKKFVCEIDSAAVYVNASTRLTEGEQFGMGCTMGVSTQKLHVRGPIGLEELTSYKYVVLGDGQVR